MAEYNPVPGVASGGGVGSPHGLNVNPNMFGGGLAEAAGEIGQRVERIAQQSFEAAQKLQAMDNETHALDASNKLSEELDKTELEFRQYKGINAKDHVAEYEDRVHKLQQQYVEAAPNPMTRLAVQRAAAQYGRGTLNSIHLHSFDQSEAANKDASKGAIEAAKSRFVLHYGLSDTLPDLQEIQRLSAEDAFSQGMSKEAADAYMQANATDAYSQVINARLAFGHIDQAQAALEEAMRQKVPGTDTPLLDGKAIGTLYRTLTNSRDAVAGQQRAAIEWQDRQDRQAYGAAVAKATTSLVQKDGSIAITPEYFQILSQAGMSRGAQLDPDGQRAAINFGLTIQHDQESGVNIVTDPHVYDDFRRRLILTPNDPSRLTSPQIYQARMDRRMSDKDSTFFLRALDDLSKDPNKIEMEKRYSETLAGLKPSVAPTSDMFGNILNAEQAQKWLYYQNDTRGLMEQAYKDGTWRELLDPRSARYIGKIIAPYTLGGIKDRVPLLKGKLTAGTQLTAPPAAPAYSITPRLPGETPEAYLKRTGQ